MLELLTQPFSGAALMRGAKKLARKLRERTDLRQLRVARMTDALGPRARLDPIAEGGGAGEEGEKQ